MKTNQPTYTATIRTPESVVLSRVKFPNTLEASAYIHDCLRFERFGRGCSGEITQDLPSFTVR